MVAFVVRPGQKAVVMVPLGLSKTLAERIDRWRASYGAGKRPLAGSPDPAMELRKSLWEPLAKHMGGAKMVLVSPDGPLHGLPWAALPGAEKDTFLIQDEYAFAILPVPQLLPDLLRARPHPAKERPSLLLVGGIAFGDKKTRGGEKRAEKLPPLPVFKPLSGTESEVNDLRTQFEDAFPDASAPKILRKDKATKATVLAAAPSHRFVHLATHGFFVAEPEKTALLAKRNAALLRGDMGLHAEATGRHPGLMSGLVFAGVNRADKREEAILTALEASELGLDKVELVVLSACETGRGQVADGEGVLGLQRAFQLAGTRSVVASLWSVPDTETHQLMREFYRRVWADKPASKAEALRQAQLWMLENAKPRGGLERPGAKGPVSPFYWAAFVLSGDWR